jgi:hypothetical protein
MEDGRVSLLLQHIANECEKAPPDMLLQAKLQRATDAPSFSDSDSHNFAQDLAKETA